MKEYKSFWSFILVMLPVTIQAHAGMADRFLEQMVTYRALFVVLVAGHLLCYLLIRWCKNSIITWLKSILRRIAKVFCYNNMSRMIAGWLLSSFVYGIYLITIGEQIFFLGGLFILAFVLFFYYPITLIASSRNKMLCGYKAIYKYLQTAIIQSMAIAIYHYLIYADWFRKLLSYTDDEYQLCDFYLYPEALDEHFLIDMACIYVLFLVPFIIVLTILIIIFLIKKIKSYKKKE